MRLTQLHIQNFRCYEDITLDFQSSFNLIVGANGSGKTSALLAVAASLAPFVLSMMPRSNNIFLVGDSDVRFVVEKVGTRASFERRYPLQLHAKGEGFGLLDWEAVKARADNALGIPGPIRKAVAATLSEVDQGKTVDLPLVAMYQANRRWLPSNATVESAAAQKQSRFEAYSHWDDAAVHLADFETWFMAKTLERLESFADGQISIDTVDDELAWVNGAIKCALPGAVGFRYDIKLRSLMVGITQDKYIPFSDLSDGQRGMIALIADIARRACLLNPHLGNQVLQKTSGVVIIDELDIHLHPAWQRSIVHALMTTFPSLQFIAASHSAQIIGSLKPEQVVVLENGSSSNPRVTYGLDASRVLEEVMGIPQREPDIEKMLSQLFSILEDNDLDQARIELAKLKAKAPDLPEFARAEALLKRKELIGR